ncbi:polysaccharide pyruvyl transferase family protein [Sporomusa acidovorans]|uniref:Polysaccharide pyruvyl transferase domain-containing protein n=1 Tax=Sporomusa acidovorans (strain ATCC 49682 / DSM 3132 / Mol) TaxID=1123286 RepID=A0ABZ3IYI9_SPOA4|nr:polysaccharide pyruvyl transferase family protein [Sporomusa acidovorans]OZC17243.1 polysaccharide pyruvyl transferase [Sporomusa acidovorans DSM 3132]SDF15545.1 Polysaccharide pyruvyl transferase family protein WcaK [Sporomusa acidovorans]
MKKIILFDTSVATANKGDEIIMEASRKAIHSITKNSFVMTMPTHTPIFHWYQTTRRNSLVTDLNNIDYKFVCGTNLLSTNMISPWPSWNINLFNCKPIKDCILLGVGCGIISNKINYYTRKLYRSILSHDFIHSVRDNITKEMLSSLGFKAINTGCTTIWSLDSNLCNQIPHNKAKAVVFTLTDYFKDRNNDQKLINVLKENYEEIYFWPQGLGDYEYFHTLDEIGDISIIPPSICEYAKILEKDIDYVGTRLHGGIYAMQHKKRSIIIVVDHRAREMNKTYKLNCIERNNLDQLSGFINSSISTQINPKQKNIEVWLSQFK